MEAIMNGKTGLAAFYHYPVHPFIHHHKSKGWLLAALLILVLTLLPIYAETTVRVTPDSQGSLTAGNQVSVEVNPHAAPPIKESENPSAFSYLIPAAGTLAGWGLWAGCLYTGLLLMGRRTTYQMTFRMIVCAWIPIALRGVVQAVYISITQCTITNQGLSGLVETTTFMPVKLLVWQQVLGSIDIYTLAFVVLLITGTMRLGNVSVKKAVLLVSSFALLMMTCSAIPALIGQLAQNFIISSSFGG
jgi:hypothetical protein